MYHQANIDLQTLETLGFIILNRILSLLWTKVQISRVKKDRRHLLKGTRENLQLENTTCPSSKRWPIQCSCVEAYKIVKMTLVEGINLVFVLSMAIDNQCKKVKKFVDLKNKQYRIRLMIVYLTTSLKHHYLLDQESLEPTRDDNRKA